MKNSTKLILWNFSFIVPRRGLSYYICRYFSISLRSITKSLSSPKKRKAVCVSSLGKQKKTQRSFFVFVPRRGLEPPWVTPLAPKASASTISPPRHEIIQVVTNNFFSSNKNFRDPASQFCLLAKHRCGSDKCE